jgi:hypothetical protein
MVRKVFSFDVFVWSFMGKPAKPRDGEEKINDLLLRDPFVRKEW